MTPLAAVLVALGLLLANAFFVGAEFALISSRRTQFEPRAAAGSRSARLTLRAMDRVSLMLAAAQLGITLCSLGLGAVGEPAVAHLLEPVLSLVSLPGNLVPLLSFGLALAVVVSLHVVLGEMVPKNIALAAPERSALALTPVLTGFSVALRPVVWLLNAGANLGLRALRVEAREEVSSTFTHDQVAGLIDESRREGLLGADVHDLLAGALHFFERTVDAVLLPLDTLVTVSAAVTPAQVDALCSQTRFSRFPVRSDSGSLAGYLHIMDALETDPSLRGKPIAAENIRPLVTIPAGTPLHEALAAMRRAGAHLGQLVDEAEMTLGVVAMEDVLEELVGEIRDAAASGRP